MAESPVLEIPLSFTPSLIERVGLLMQEEQNPSLCLRIQVQGGGCSGFKYDFQFIDASALQPHDLLVYAQAPSSSQPAQIVAVYDPIVNEGPFEAPLGDCIRFAVDPVSLQYLEGAEIDFVNDLKGERIVIRNPNASTTCGCGSSFSVGDD